MTDYKLVPVDTLKSIYLDLDACQKVIWRHGGFDPAYWRGAQARLKEIDELLVAPNVQGEPVAGGPLHPSQVRALRRNVKRNCPPEIYALLDQAITAPQSAEQQPDVTQLVEALEDIGASWHGVQTELEKYMRNVARRALATYRQKEDEA